VYYGIPPRDFLSPQLKTSSYWVEVFFKKIGYGWIAHC
jgi:hypothetical protein